MIDIDGPLIPDKMHLTQVFMDIPFYKDGYPTTDGEGKPVHKEIWHAHVHDPFSTMVLNKLFEHDDIYGVLHSTWRLSYDEEWMKKHFEMQGVAVRWHDDMFTNPKIFDRWQSIRDWLGDHPEIVRDNFAILENEKPPEDLKSRTIRVDEVSGLSYTNVKNLSSLFRINLRDK